MFGEYRQIRLLKTSGLEDVENAVRHAPGLTRVAVRTGLGPDGNVTVRVIDDGPGIPGERAESVFLPHERGAEGPGAGLGLAIARGIVEAHGGTIGLEAVASGTSVLVTLPVEPASQDPR